MKEWKAVKIPKDEWVKIELLAIEEMKKGKKSGVATIIRQWIKDNTK